MGVKNFHIFYIISKKMIGKWPMCLLIIAYKIHPKYRLILAANRDEYYSRPSDHLNFWKENPCILAGKDLKYDGTWLGITRKGRFAAVTNFRDPSALRDGRPSRGLLVRRYLETDMSPSDYLNEVKRKATEYNPFNLVLGDRKDIWYYSNRAADIKRLEPGIYGLSNHLLDTPWPKVRRAKEGVKRIIEQDQIEIKAIFELLKDRTIPPDNELPDTGVGYEKERMLAPIFIKSPDYGTRSSSIILVEEKMIHFYERNYMPSSSPEERDIEFHIILN